MYVCNLHVLYMVYGSACISVVCVCIQFVQEMYIRMKCTYILVGAYVCMHAHIYVCPHIAYAAILGYFCS